MPGRGAAPAELLAVGPPPEERPHLPRRLRALTGAVLLVLGAGVASAVELEGRPPPPAVLPLPTTVTGVTARAEVAAAEEGVVRLLLSVRVEGEATGRGDTGGEGEAVPLVLLDAAARGFSLRPVGVGLPTRLADVGRFSSGRPVVVPVSLDVVVSDCAVDTRAQRRIVLSLRRGTGPTGTVVVASEPAVVDALDALVSRTCRRPRG